MHVTVSLLVRSLLLLPLLSTNAKRTRQLYQISGVDLTNIGGGGSNFVYVYAVPGSACPFGRAAGACSPLSSRPCPPDHWCQAGVDSTSLVCCPVVAQQDRQQYDAGFGGSCQGSPDPGETSPGLPTNVAVTRYFFDMMTGNCEPFLYRGRKGNANNYPTLKHCQVACMGHVWNNPYERFYFGDGAFRDVTGYAFGPTLLQTLTVAPSVTARPVTPVYDLNRVTLIPVPYYPLDGNTGNAGNGNAAEVPIPLPTTTARPVATTNRIATATTTASAFVPTPFVDPFITILPVNFPDQQPTAVPIQPIVPINPGFIASVPGGQTIRVPIFGAGSTRQPVNAAAPLTTATPNRRPQPQPTSTVIMNPFTILATTPRSDGQPTITLAARQQVTTSTPPSPIGVFSTQGPTGGNVNFVYLPNPCCMGAPLTDDRGYRQTCTESSHCPTSHWCHVGASIEYNACCPNNGAQRQTACQQPAAVGAGPFRLRRWFYEPVSRSCQQMTYFGLMGNQNNFVTEQLCEATCVEDLVGGSVCQVPPPAPGTTCTDTTDCAVGFWCHRSDIQQDNICCPDFDEPQCRQPLAEGQGPASLRRWYYDPQEGECGTCLPFAYHGRQGNQNNFASQDACERTCSACYSVCPRGGRALQLLAADGLPVSCGRSRPCPNTHYCREGTEEYTPVCCPRESVLLTVVDYYVHVDVIYQSLASGSSSGRNDFASSGAVSQNVDTAYVVDTDTYSRTTEESQRTEVPGLVTVAPVVPDDVSMAASTRAVIAVVIIIVAGAIVALVAACGAQLRYSKDGLCCWWCWPCCPCCCPEGEQHNHLDAATTVARTDTEFSGDDLTIGLDESTLSRPPGGFLPPPPDVSSSTRRPSTAKWYIEQLDEPPSYSVPSRPAPSPPPRPALPPPPPRSPPPSQPGNWRHIRPESSAETAYSLPATAGASVAHYNELPLRRAARPKVSPPERPPLPLNHKQQRLSVAPPPIDQSIDIDEKSNEGEDELESPPLSIYNTPNPHINSDESQFSGY